MYIEKAICVYNDFCFVFIITCPKEAEGPFSARPTRRMQSAWRRAKKGRKKGRKKEEKMKSGEKVLPGRESNPGLPRDRRRYLPLYYRGSLSSVSNIYIPYRKRLRVRQLLQTCASSSFGVVSKECLRSARTMR